MSAVPKLRLVERAPEPFHDRSPVDEIDWAEIEREQRAASIGLLAALVGIILFFSGIIMGALALLGWLS